MNKEKEITCKICRKCGASTVRDVDACYKCGHTWFNIKKCVNEESCATHGCLRNN